jgi:hypothetical protein
MSIAYFGRCTIGCTRGCPAPVRPGTPTLFCVLCCMCVPRPSLGVQGALVARLLDPLPFSRSMLFAHDCSLGMDARSCSLRLKGKGSRPCTPTNRQRSSSWVWFHDQAGSSSPMGRASWPPTGAVCCFVNRVFQRSVRLWPFHPMATVRVFQGDAGGVSSRCSGHGSAGTVLCPLPPLLWKD